MAVAEPFRGESKAEFLKNFHRLRKEINMLMMRDFGIKPRKYNVDLIKEIYELNEEDAALLSNMSEKYGMNTFYTEKYPKERIYEWKKELCYIMNQLGICIEQGNSRNVKYALYPTAEYLKRTEYFEDAIGYCQALKDKFHEILDILDVKTGQYITVSKLLKREISLLKGVKRSDKDALAKAKAKIQQATGS